MSRQSTQATRTYTPATVRLVEIRLLDGPNVYRLEPAVKVEVVVGRRRTWYGQRTPGRHASVRLGAVVAARTAPASVTVLAAWVRRLHALSGAAGWLADEGRAVTATRARISVTIHRTSEPGHWIVSYPWREKERAEAIAESALERKIGARGLRMIIEDLMLDLMYSLPNQKKVRECVITREVVEAKDKPITLVEKAG